MVIYPSRKIDLELPKNIRSDDLELFNSHATYYSDELKIEEYIDVTLVPSGIAIKNERLIPETIHRYEHLYSNFEESVKTQLETGQLRVLDGKKYLLIHNHWCGGYYHWVIEALSRLWISRTLLDEVIFLNPMYPARIRSIQAESLKPFGIGETFEVTQGVNMRISNLLVPSNYNYLGTFVPEVIHGIREVYQRYIRDNIEKLPSYGERIYVTRKNAGRRKIVNEQEMLELLSYHGFKIISAEDHSFFEQVSIFYNAKYLVSIYGAALTNMIFMKEGGRVFEMQKRLTAKDEEFDSVFFRLASVCHLEYYYQFCEPVDLNEPKITADIVVDIDDFNKSLNMFVSHQG